MLDDPEGNIPGSQGAIKLGDVARVCGLSRVPQEFIKILRDHIYEFLRSLRPHESGRALLAPCNNCSWMI